MVAGVIFSIFMILLGMTFQSGNQQIEITHGKMTAEDAVRTSLSRMVRELQQADPSEVRISPNGQSITFRFLSGVDSSGEIVWSNPVTYEVNSASQLIRKDLVTDETEVVAYKVTHFRVLKGTGNPPPYDYSLEVDVQENTPHGRRIPVTRSSQVTLRNGSG